MMPTPTLALHTSRCGKRLVLLAALTGLTAFLSSSVAGAQTPQGRSVRVMTQNMYMGNLAIIRLGAADLPRAVEAFFNDTVNNTKPQQRAAAVAQMIRDNQPDLVALQEVSILRMGSGDDPNNPKIPATKVKHDQLQLLREALAGLNPPQHYDTVAVIPNSDVQSSTSTLNFVVRLTDRTVILARAGSNDLKLSNVQVEQFLAQPVVSPQLIGRFGWGSVDVEVNARKFRFVATHLMPAGLDPALIAIQNAQASELIQSAGKDGLPVVYAGDFNTVYGLATYGTLVDGFFGRVDAWRQKNPTVSCPEGHPDRGCTCCHDALGDAASKLTHRVDLVIVPPSPEIEEVKLVGADQPDQASGLWPSDHAGVVIRFRE